MSDPYRPLLLVRPAPEAAEGVADYLQRLAKANGYVSATQLTMMLQVPLNLLELAGHEILQDVLHGRSPRECFREFKPANGRLGPYHSGFGISNEVRVCASCLKQSDVLDSRWNDPLTIGCATHRELLLDRCPDCGRPIMRGDSAYRCRCGFHYRNHAPEALPDWAYQFYQYFVPWQLEAEGARNEAQLRYELKAAKYLRSAIGPAAHSVSVARRRLFSTDHLALEKLVRSGYTSITAWDADLKASKILSSYWRANRQQLPTQVPQIFERIEQERSQLRRISGLVARQQAAARHRTADSISNLARAMNCNFITARSLNADPEWQALIRAHGSPARQASLLDCIKHIWSRTVSLNELMAILGIPVNWARHFLLVFPQTLKVFRLVSRNSRVPFSLAQQLASGFSTSRERAIPARNCPEGYVPLAALCRKSLQERRWVLEELLSGALPLAYEHASAPDQLIDFSIPLNALLARPTSGFRPKPGWPRQHVIYPAVAFSSVVIDDAIPA